MTTIPILKQRVRVPTPTGPVDGIVVEMERSCLTGPVRRVLWLRLDDGTRAGPFDVADAEPTP